ncbi:MAG: ribonuclease D [Myxococcota bacterium]|jgi:ribonuclease D
MTIRLAGPNDFEAAITEIGDADRVAVDTEFHAEGRFLPELFLLQVRVPSGNTWMFDAKGDGGIRRLGPVLCGRPWVLHAGQQDLRILQAWFGALPDVVYDTQIAAGLLCERYPEGYASLVHRYLGSTIEKVERLSDWSARPLRPEQLAYAAADVQLLFALWDRLVEDLTALDRLSVVQAACADRLPPASPKTAAPSWRNLMAVPALDDPSVKALEALAAWRRTQAVDNNMPERSVLGDGLMIQLSRARPDSIRALRANRRMPKSVVRRHGEAIVGVMRAVAADPAPAPLVARFRTPEWRRLDWLDCFAQCLARDESWSANLVLPRPLLAELACATPLDRESLDARLGWRSALAGAQLWEAMAGQVTLSFGADVARGPAVRE